MSFAIMNFNQILYHGLPTSLLSIDHSYFDSFKFIIDYIPKTISSSKRSMGETEQYITVIISGMYPLN